MVMRVGVRSSASGGSWGHFGEKFGDFWGQSLVGSWGFLGAKLGSISKTPIFIDTQSLQDDESSEEDEAVPDPEMKRRIGVVVFPWCLLFFLSFS